MAFPWATAISVGSSLAGLFGKGKKGPDANDQLSLNARATENNIVSIVRGAERAGVHPLYALGAPPAAPLDFQMGTRGDDTVSRLAEMGQNIGNAVHRMGTKEERAFGMITARLAVERGELENELLKSQIAQINANMTPGISTNNNGQIIPGQANGAIAVVPSESISTARRNRGVEAATTPSNKIYVGFDGRPILSPNSQFAESLEGNWPVGMMQNLVHNTLPFYAKVVIPHEFKKFVRRGRSRYYKQREGG